MAMYDNCRAVSVKVNVSSSTAAALVNRFCIWDSTADRVITHVPGANGAAARGVLQEAVDTQSDGVKYSSMVVPDGGIVKILLGEAVVTVGSALRVGGNSSETDGAAYLANASNDVIVGYALETGSVGDIIAMHFVGYHGLVP